MTTEAGPERDSPIGDDAPALADRKGDVTVAVTPQQLAFLALIAGVILVVLRRIIGRARAGRRIDTDA